MKPSPSNAPMPVSTNTAPVTPTEVLAALERLHKKTDVLLNLIHRKPQP